MLQKNYPNPFYPETFIGFDLPEGAQVTVSVLDISVRLVKQLANGRYGPGSHTVVWDGRDEQGKAAPAGLYFYSIRTGDFIQTRKMMKLR